MPFYRDMELVCRNCGATFIFTAGEQEFYADKGFLHEPTRCPKCRSRRDSPREGDEHPNRKESSARQQR
jgi:DNA-directed RNA polymerase subunit RPC12/RpoP